MCTPALIEFKTKLFLLNNPIKESLKYSAILGDAFISALRASPLNRIGHVVELISLSHGPDRSQFQALCQCERLKKRAGKERSRFSPLRFFDRPHWPRAWNRLPRPGKWQIKVRPTLLPWCWLTSPCILAVYVLPKQSADLTHNLVSRCDE